MGYTTQLDRKSLQKIIGSYSSIFGQAQTPANNYRYKVDPCDVYEKRDGPETIRYRPSNSPVDSIHDCGIPDLIQGSDEPVVNSVPGTGLELSVKKLSSFDPSSIGSHLPQVWFVLDYDYYEEDLGCSVIGILCENPRSKPIQAP